MNRFVRPLTAARHALAGVLLAHLLAIMVMAASPQLHHWLHPDADQHDHDCAVVLFLHGGGDAAPGPVMVPTFVGTEAAAFAQVAGPVVFVPSVFAASRVFEHAPPVAG